MVNFEWRIGVAVCSSKCNNIYAPYVAVSFDINEPNGQTTSHNAELTYEQFKVIISHLFEYLLMFSFFSGFLGHFREGFPGHGRIIERIIGLTLSIVHNDY